MAISHEIPYLFSMAAPSLGKTIRERRDALHLSLRDLARRVGVSAAYLCRIEKHEHEPPPSEETLFALAHALDIDATLLFHLARRLPPDVSAVLRDDVMWCSVIRAAKARDISGFQVLQLVLKI
jgi:PTS system nitrogen regulatory IIA component